MACFISAHGHKPMEINLPDLKLNPDFCWEEMTVGSGCASMGVHMWAEMLASLYFSLHLHY